MFSLYTCYIMLCNQIIEHMNNLNIINDSSSEAVPKDTHVFQLPSLSAQACPITTVTSRENSVLTKRISYSENLKDRSFVQLPKPRLSDRSIDDESTSEKNAVSVVTDDEEYTKRRCSVQLFRRKSLQSKGVASSCSIDESNSFKECQQIFAKIHQRFSHKSLKKSSVAKSPRARGEINKDIFPRRKRKQSLCTAVLLKNDISRRNNTLNPCSKSLKKQPNHHHPKKKKREQDGKQNLEHIILENIYKHPFRCNTDKLIPHKEKLLKKTKEMENEIKVHAALPPAYIPSAALTPAAPAPAAPAPAALTPAAKTIYYSEKQSLTVDGVPCVPPTTPNEMSVRGIASLSDVKSQRTIQQKLKCIRRKQKKREIELLEAAKAKEIEEEILKRKELVETQRRQIYAINKVLADIEHEEFLKFSAEMKGMPV